MNPSSSRSGPFQQLHGCEGDGCASAIETWPLHLVHRDGVPIRLCSSCILLSHRSYYCCSCFFLIPCPSLWSADDAVAPFIAQPAPITTCQVCRDAISHLDCLQAANGVFVCPACSAAAEGRPFTYAPPCGTPLDQRGARVLVVGARIALVLLQRNADMALAKAEQLARSAEALRRRAYQAIGAAVDFDTKIPSWNTNVQSAAPPLTSENLQKLGEGSQNVNAPPLPRENRLEMGEGSQTNVNAPPLVQLRRRAMPLPLEPLSNLTISRGSVTRLAMAATEAARDSFTGVATAAAEASSPTPPTLQLLPAKASSSRTRRRARSPLFRDKIPEDEDI